MTIISVLVGAAALVLGFSGYRELPGQELSSGDALYRAIQLFVLDYNAAPGQAPWQLEVGRFLAAGVTVLTVSAVLFTVAREQTQRLRIRAWGQRHIVIIGLGNRGARIAHRLRVDRGRIAAIERDRANGQVPGIRAQGMPVIVGDGRSDAILDAARITRTSDVLIVSGDDSTSLGVLAACHSRLAESTRPPTRIHVAIDDLALWRELHRLGLARDDQPTRTEFLSIPDRIAGALVSSSVEDVPSVEGEDHLLIHGCGPTAVRTSIHAIRRSLLAGNKVNVTLAGTGAEDVEGELTGLEPWASDSAAIRVEVQGMLGRSKRPTAAFVCGLPEAEALAAGAAIAHTLEGSEVPVYIAVPDEDTEQALVATRFELPALRLIPAEARVLGPALFEHAALEVIARAKHEDYVSQEKKRGIGPAENPSVIPWDELDESLRESNRRFAESIGTKLGELHASLVPLTGRVPENGLPLSPTQLEQLAEHEHERWVRDQLADNWKWAEGEKDPAAKRHPMLVDWQELPESERRKDREGIQALPEALAQVGYALAIPTSEGGSR